MEPEKKALPKKMMFILIIGVFLVLCVTGGYYLMAKFFKDREKILNNEGRYRKPTLRGPEQTIKTYTPEELEQAQKNGLVHPPSNPIPQGQADVLRSLNTIEEINRINAMNQRLMEEQRRIQNLR